METMRSRDYRMVLKDDEIRVICIHDLPEAYDSIEEVAEDLEDEWFADDDPYGSGHIDDYDPAIPKH